MTDTRNPILRKYGPGKFDTILDSAIYGLSLDGCDDECGDSSNGDRWYGKLDGPFMSDELGAELTQAELAYLAESAAGGAILSEDSQGFVTIEYFAAADQLETAWERIAEADAAQLGDEGDDAPNLGF